MYASLARPQAQAPRGSAPTRRIARPTAPAGLSKELAPIRLTGGPVSIGGVPVEPGAQLVLSQDGRDLFLMDRQGQLIALDGGFEVGDVHDPREMMTYLAGYANAGFRHEESCQVIPVQHDSDKFRTFNSSRVFRPAAVKTTDYDALHEVSFESSLTNYTVIARRICSFVPDPVAAQANGNWNVIASALEHLKLLIDMDLEIDVHGLSGLLTTSGNWTSGYSVLLGLGFQWGGTSGIGASSDPIKDLQTMAETSAQPIRKYWMNRRISNMFLRHPAVRDHLRSRLGDDPVPGPINTILDGLPPSQADYTIPGIGDFGIVDAKAESGASSLDFIFPDYVVGATQPPGRPTDGNRVATAYNFRVVSAENANVGFGIRQFRVDNRGAPGTMVVVEEKSIPTMTSTISGGLLRGVSQ